jgi:hypothetical protein
MMRNLDFRARRWGVVILLLGCTRWESYAVPSPVPALPSSLRISTTGQAPTVVVHPFVRHDTLYGSSRGDTVGIALTAIEHLERPRLDGLRTTATVVGGMAAWITVGLLSGGLE